ncbi:cation:proton antiporter [Priestia taiwanensis]|uniref:Sodium:proton antiporter n=1 Tax=Priestia taiwanensis TaxID=1347902 RepID=A0A917ASM5_9BACI|nr:cation:proton antiporter [Priestia taiwanensis]MBM7363889.1 monovalent cation:proton antiporter-2 (CPA2) family protein [Priestia taiwanensis]GGE69863.1 sodium:proton antiporter [Priestia taiwanensis]
MYFFFTLAIILLCTKLAGDLSVRLGQPSVLGKLIVGIIIGPAMLNWVPESDMLTQMAQIGVLLLMFMAGLETDLDELNKNRNSAVAVAVGGIIFPFLLGGGAAYAFGLSMETSIFIGLLLSATSVSISVQALRDLGQSGSKESTTMLGAAIVDDILVVIALAFAMTFLGEAGDISLSMIVLKKFIFFAAIFFLGWKVVPLVLRLLSPLNVTESLISAALIICFSFAYFAEQMGIAGIIGAFAAGIAISQTKYKHDVEHKLEPIAYAIFVPIFFVSVGAQISFDGVMDNMWFIVVLSIVAIITKLVGGGLGARLTGFGKTSSLAIGAGMVSRGEVALIIATMGLDSKLLPQELFTSVVIVVILTTIVTPPMLKVIFDKKAREDAANKQAV